MSKLSRNVNRFMARNRNKGIPRLMLWVGILNIIIYGLYMFMRGTFVGDLLEALRFEPDKILGGWQLWRLVTYPLTIGLQYGGGIMGGLNLLLSCYVWYWTWTVVENIWGTFKSNLYYFSGVLLTSLTAILLAGAFNLPVYVTGSSLHNTIFLVVATLIPNERVLAFFFIPIRMRWMALISIGMNAFYLFRGVLLVGPQIGFGYAVVLLGVEIIVCFLHYLLFVGKDFLGLFGRRPVKRVFRQNTDSGWGSGPSRPKTAAQSHPGEKPYHHKCTVCGRTDTECPDLEFRYCSKCKGNFCYCIDHINNHTHIQ